ncbi:hypothetical protein PR202_ga26153 [Eleusine coracana subsp. coracana]|uniref:PsbP C-terminal domain-containing protein n=1 Tax=Eleusine coracana subsp. coracana TaxID=191504 RepID=A0AAV5DCI8_ELECO|nr:hypothetical protein PR202_ga26153 [Eleusine coracana subsp. coracana]
MASLQNLICSVSKQLVAPNFAVAAKINGAPPTVVNASSSEASLDGKNVTKRRLALLGAGALATGLLKKSSAFAEAGEIKRSFVLFLQRTVDGKNYWTFEYDLEAPGYGVSAFATVAVGNGTIKKKIAGRYYTLIVTANERRWSRLRNKLKVVADSFKISDLTA